MMLYFLRGQPYMTQIQVCRLMDMNFIPKANQSTASAMQRASFGSANTKKKWKKNGVHLWVHTKTEPVFLIVWNERYTNKLHNNKDLLLRHNILNSVFTLLNLLGYNDKNSESDYFFPSTKIRIFVSATLGIRIFF
jgi:hypothetical protein